ncbi:MAG: ABC transporter permease [Lachnospiraceae bacterium]|nr:ABC transporter permease [Lachnospiraceae bacterium]
MTARLIKRNSKLFFKDKGMFFTSLITPLILLILYATFLAGIFRDAYRSGLPEGILFPDRLLDGLVAGQLIASLLAVSCVTVTFCVNLIMIQDKTTGAIKDITIAPVKKTTLALSYYISTLISTLIVNLVTFGIGLLFIKVKGWYLSSGDILAILLDILLLCMFATALSSIVCYPLKTQGAASAVGTLISSVYGFICGAYMPISSFGEGLQKVLSFLPGTYGTSLLKNHLMRGAFQEMLDIGFPKEAVEGIKTSIDCNPVFLGHHVTIPEMIMIMVVSIVILMAVYIMINIFSKKRKA